MQQPQRVLMFSSTPPLQQFQQQHYQQQLHKGIFLL